MFGSITTISFGFVCFACDTLFFDPPSKIDFTVDGINKPVMSLRLCMSCSVEEKKKNTVNAVGIKSQHTPDYTPVVCNTVYTLLSKD